METSIFLSNRSQVIRLPKALELPDNIKRVDIIAIGKVRIITPVGTSWDIWFEGEGVSEDFMILRNQPTIKNRD
ncbi:type II toxin-antitoxin system VapB family antitoxin [Serratia nevei]|uniref:type II toxin-antitoxin system VapB family antitoxin n=1 Tax=Serratia nevei TaxID=2703794 RepID=UPI002855D67D|nr:type II toxin-antitoxin system VapB family antitoxin [Serratia nevei]MDR8492140.1 type II toxin-antitoxin system VapB family antitoxin [Serratia nevei]